MSNNPNPSPFMAPAPVVPPIPPKLPLPYAIATLAPNLYQATFDVSRLTPSADEFASVYLWLSTLTEKDTVKFNFIETGLKGIAPFEDHIALLNCIMLCSAKTIAVLDKMYLGLECYFIMACKAVEITDFALLGVPSVYPAEAERLTEKDEAVVMAGNQLIANAVEHLKILTQEEAITLVQRQTVFVQADELKSRITQ